MTDPAADAAEKTPTIPAPTGEAAPVAAADAPAVDAPAPTFPDGAQIPAEAIAAAAALPVGDGVPPSAEVLAAAPQVGDAVKLTMMSGDKVEVIDAVVAVREPAAPKVPLPTVGRIVLFSMRDRNGVIQSRPAIVVNVFGRSDGQMPLVNLQVFSDGANDKRPDGQHMLWATSCSYDEGCSERSWHWMPYQLGQAAKTAEAEAKAAAPAGGVPALESLAGELARLRGQVERALSDAGHPLI